MVGGDLYPDLQEFRAAVGSNDTERIQEVTRLITWNIRGLGPAQLGPPPSSTLHLSLVTIEGRRTSHLRWTTRF